MPEYTSLLEYLEATGVLINGTKEQIKAAKREYRRIYLREYKKRQRREHTSTVISLAPETYEQLRSHASAHNLTLAAFMQKAALAYVQKRYLVPYQHQVAEVEQLLSFMYEEIKKIGNAMHDSSYEHLLLRIEHLEHSISRMLRHPLTLEETIVRQIQLEPGLRDHFIQLLFNL